jgi:hypothetical protein
MRVVPALRLATELAIVLVAAMSLLPAIRARLEGAMVARRTVSESDTAQQYVIVKWISSTLKPRDGAVGYFYLGIAYFAPSFEAADFLGKADERIAGTKVKWGPPGHNKWDIDTTLAKWNPQAIIPAAPSDPWAPGAEQRARAALAEHRDFGFVADLMLNRRVRREYAYCYLREGGLPTRDRWGFFLRTDIVPRIPKRDLSCHQVASSL